VFSTNGMLVGLVVAGYEKTNISYVVPINLFSSFFQAAGMELQHCPQVSQVLPLKYFKDCEDCPEMVVVQAGDFLMGSPKEERDRQSSEGPQHMVRISRPFAVGRYAVTVKEFRAFTNETGREPDAGCFVWDQKDQAWKFDLKIHIYRQVFVKRRVNRLFASIGMMQMRTFNGSLIRLGTNIAY
jgi:formylglycine-generating enzyme required for sulfatase activity